MDDIDRLLTIIENRTRRRILEMITEAPSYPLQLSKELGVSQQAVMKNLALMEQNGLVSSYRESSNMGPERIVYVPNKEFTLVIDLNDRMFSARVIGLSDRATAQDEREMEILEKAEGRIGEIDRRLARLEAEKAELIRMKNETIDSVMGSLPEGMDEAKRKAVYERLSRTTGRADPSE